MSTVYQKWTTNFPLLIIGLVFNCLFATTAKASYCGPEDTVVVAPSIAIKQNSLVQNMNKEQLNVLVDFLLELDSIPQDLMDEITTRISKINKASQKKIEIDKNNFPSADLYASWEINKLFPEVDMLKLKGDTSVILKLDGDERGTYFHPFNGPITSTFGWRDSAQHNGIDIDLNKGDNVSAAFNGMVRFAKRFGGFGNVVIIRHYNGLETVYAHLWKIKVKPGDIVTAGQVIGLGGSTGHSTGSHLHFEVRFKGVPINPKYLISLQDQKLLCSELTIKKSKWGIAAFPTASKHYTVEKGDTVFEIAKRYGTTTASIKQMNGFTAGRIRLKVGQVINVAQ